MATDPRKQCLLVLAKMALQDGVITAEERSALEDMSGGATVEEINAAIEEAYDIPFDELVAGVEKYEDRFLIALRAFHVAHSDKDFDVGEAISFEMIIEAFDITEDDRDLIERVQGAMAGQAALAPEPRLIEIHRGSSFFSGVEF